MLSPITVFLKSPELGNVPNLDFEKEQVGLETVKDLGSKTVLDAFTCVECGRCQVNCPAWGAGKELNPKTIILQTQDALLAGERETKLGEVYTEKVLWQCTTCGACENQCPVGIEHLPLIIGARRGLVSNGDAPDVPRRRSTTTSSGAATSGAWATTSGRSSSTSAALEIFDPARHDVLVWLGCAGAFEADFQKSLRSLFDILRAKGVTLRRAVEGALHRRLRPSGPATSTCSRSWPTPNIEDLKAAGAEEDPHVVPALREDDRRRLPASSATRWRSCIRRCSSRS